MAKIEKLLSVDPIGAFDKIKENYLRYFRTMYKFRESSSGAFDDYTYLNTALYGTFDDHGHTLNKGIIEKDGNLYQEPYCELLPEYKSTGRTIQDLQDNDYAESKPLPQHFAEFISRGLMKTDDPTKPYLPYEHQYEMLKLAYGQKKSVVITSGTGSGKTESFLLPLFASLLDEASRWPEQYYDKAWHTKNTEGAYDRAYQRLGEINRPAAIRAMVLYPMNALVNDQMGRLRQAIDSDEVRNFFDDPQYGYHGNRLFFGRYNGETIGAQDQEKASSTARKKCFIELSNIVEKSKDIGNKVSQNSLDASAEFVAPRFTDDQNKNQIGAEMLTRWDIQEFPPDILITNVSMLGITMMRQYETEMFNKTRAYYTANPDAVFHLIVDELHLHRGTAGSEVAYLLRMFLDRIGVPPTVKDPQGHTIPNPQLRILASSASLGADTEKFLEDFFGVYNDNGSDVFTVIGNNAEIILHNNINRFIDYNSFAPFTTHKDANGNRYIDEGFSDRDLIINNLITTYGANTLEDFLSQYHEKVFYDLKEATKITDQDENGMAFTRYVPCPVSQLAAKLHCSVEAVRGFFIFRGDREVNNLSSKYKLPRIRFHQFYKYISGLWGELQEPDTHNGKCIGQLFYNEKESVHTNDGKTHKVLELLRCTSCGALYIGGNRYQDGSKTAILLNTPNLASIPNRNATPMVQNKVYSEYAVFLPTGRVISSDKYSIINSEGHVRRGDEEHAEWKLYYLNPYDGSLSRQSRPGFIRGYLYLLVGNTIYQNHQTDKISALPCSCPCCDADFSNRTYTKSPISNFRTGIKRSNQLLTKELIYQLNDSKKERLQTQAEENGDSEYYQPHGKLIGFSDSRQDAAEQSVGIAQEHFRDLVRYFFVKRVNEEIANGGPDAIITALKSTLVAMLQINPAQASHVFDSFKYSYPEIDILKNIIRQHGTTQAKIANINAVQFTGDPRVISLGDFVSSDGNRLDGKIVSDLLKIGVNPGAIEYADQYYGSEEIYWDQFYDFYDQKAKDDNDPTRPDCPSFKKEIIINRLTSYIFNNCFGKYMGLSTEDSGLGYVVINKPKDTAEAQVLADLQGKLDSYHAGVAAEDFLNAYIRILGDNYRFKDEDNRAEKWHGYNDPHWRNAFSSSCKKHIKEITGINNDADLGDCVSAALRVFATDHSHFLSLAKLSFKMVENTDPYYRCPKCGRVHLHRGMGKCTNTACREPLPVQPSGQVSELRLSHYIAFDILTEPREACRIHTEELTGQTDDQTTRLLDFKDVILDSKINGIAYAHEERAKVIDMLNVTTTMEVGVDIGSLQAVYQGNMPPTRYNYQQRVGRGGRRGQAFSAAVTFCRGRSHDNYYYTSGLSEITGGKPKDPTLSVNPTVNGNTNLSILKRVLLKHILMESFQEMWKSPDFVDYDWAVDGDTHGHFGKVVDWNRRIKPKLRSWFDNNQNEIHRLTEYYLRQYNLFGMDNVIDWLNNDLFDIIDTVVDGSDAEGLAQAMGEGGLLPLYGMPTTIRVLYHGTRQSGRDKFKKIDRPLEQSITEFAPGSIKTKDSGEYRSAGLTVPLPPFVIKSELKDKNAIQATYSSLDPLEKNRCMTYNADKEVISVEKENVDLQNANQVLLVIPKAFRTGNISGNNGKLRDNTDSRTAFSNSSIYINEANIAMDRSFANVDCKIWNCDTNEKTEVWHINDNNGKQFEVVRGFREDHHKNETCDPIFYGGMITTNHKDWHNDLLRNAPSYFDKRFAEKDCIEVGEREWNFASGTQKIALGANKVTDVTKISVVNYNSSINLDLNTGNIPAIKAAYYSAASLIQRYFADEIDIEPDEIEISVQKKGDKIVAYLSDKLENGAGFVKMLCDLGATGRPHLYEIMEDLVNSTNPRSKFVKALYSPSHKDSCQTACPKCLKTYSNQGLHHILDWRLGIDLIKLMLDQNYQMGMDNLSNTPYRDLENVMIGITDSVRNASDSISINCKDHFYVITEDDGSGFVDPINSYLIHPLWNESRLFELDGEMHRAQNTFELSRSIYVAKPEDELNHINLNEDIDLS